MNAEELRDIAETLLGHAEQTGIVAELERLKQAVSQQVNSPQDSNAQGAVAQAREELTATLRSGAAAEFNARWRRLVTEMGIEILLPDEALGRLDDLFLQNQVTLQVVNEGVSELATEVTSVVEQLTSLVQAFEFLNIESSGLSPGEFEAAVVIPRAEVDNSLSGLGREFVALEALIRPFVEADAGSPPPLELRQVASSDFMAAMLLTPGAATLLSQAIDHVLASYERVLHIRKLRQDLRESGLREETIAQVEEDANTLFEGEIPKIVREVMQTASNLGADSGRDNEIEIALTKSVRGIAKRVDHGFRMSVRTGPPLPTPDEEAETDSASDKHADAVAAARDLVIENQRRADGQELAGDPILRELGAGDDNEADG